MNVVTFKSSAEFFGKERSGLKNNTVRIFDDETDIRKKLLDDYISKKIRELQIIIIYSPARISFIRPVRDVSKYLNMYIITWTEI